MKKVINLKPYVTEKSSSEIENNKFTFLYVGQYNKIEILKFIEDKYEINIKSINKLKRVSKLVRRGKVQGKTKQYYKVIVTLKDHKNIEKIKELF